MNPDVLAGVGLFEVLFEGPIARAIKELQDLVEGGGNPDSIGLAASKLEAIASDMEASLPSFEIPERFASELRPVAAGLRGWARHHLIRPDDPEQRGPWALEALRIANEIIDELEPRAERAIAELRIAYVKGEAP